MKRPFSYSKLLRICFFVGLISTGIVLSLPLVLAVQVRSQQTQSTPLSSGQFPVTVDPRNKSIVENVQVNAFLTSPSSPYQASVDTVQGAFTKIFNWLALTIAGSGWYQSIAAANGRFVVITAGMRKEQVAQQFGIALGWNIQQKQQFLTPGKYASLPLAEGSFYPGIYVVSAGDTPLTAQALVNDRFNAEVLSHYGTTTAAIVPLNEALTIASLIQREAGGPNDMRVISGIIWNRLFANMNLQIDATLQYAEASKPNVQSWWPEVVPADLRVNSAYNTYTHSGLPPTPIASPSVAAILAALNPVNTSCVFYFHDANGGFHCSDTYAEHVALLKKYYGTGK